MKKELKDYLHLFLGCKIKAIAKWRNYSINGMYTLNTAILNDFEVNLRSGKIICKPILRPLSDMTEKEAIEVFKMVSLLDLSDCQFEFGENYTTWINANLNGRVIDSINFLGDNIEMMNNDGTYSPLNPIAPVHQYYLSKHFDLFGLIESGLAINSTTLTTNKKA